MTRRARRRQRRNPYAVAFAGTVLQLGLGTVYAWSYFQSMLVRDYLWTYTDSVWPFSLAILALGVSAAWAGINLPKYGPRKLAMIGAVLFSLSYLLGGVAMLLRNAPLFLFGYSIIGGIGMGLGYVTPVATVAKWFPNKSSQVIDVVIMGFGVGGFLMSMVLAPFMLANSGGDVARSFILLGMLFAVVLIPATWFLQNPPGTPGAVSDDATVDTDTARAALGSRQYVAMWLLFFCNISAGIAIISFQSSLLQEVWGQWDPSLHTTSLITYGALLIGLGSIFNGIGRLFWGAASDYLGRVESFRLLLATQIIVFGLLMTERNPQIFSGLICYVMFCFGGGFAIMPSLVQEVFGARRMPVMYGVMLTAYSAAGVAGPLMVAYLKDNYPDRAVIYCFLGGVMFLGVGFITSFLVNDDAYIAGKPALDDFGNRRLPARG